MIETPEASYHMTESAAVTVSDNPLAYGPWSTVYEERPQPDIIIGAFVVESDRAGEFCLEVGFGNAAAEVSQGHVMVKMTPLRKTQEVQLPVAFITHERVAVRAMSDDPLDASLRVSLVLVSAQEPA